MIQPTIVPCNVHMVMGNTSSMVDCNASARETQTHEKAKPTEVLAANGISGKIVDNRME